MNNNNTNVMKTKFKIYNSIMISSIANIQYTYIIII